MFKVNLKTKDLTESELRKVNQAAEHFEAVFNHPTFHDWVLNFSYQINICTGKLWWKKCRYEQRRTFWYNQGLTNFQVLNRLLEGKETLGEVGESGDADLWLEVDRRNRRGVIGYTYPNTRTQWVYQWVMNSYDVRDIAGNLAHEWCHKIGFDHEYQYTQQRQYSVPYAIGYCVSSFKL